MSEREWGEADIRTLLSILPVGVFAADSEGLYTYVNLRWSEITGISMEAARGRGWEEGLHPEDRATTVRDWYAAVKRGAIWKSRHRLRSRMGKEVWVLEQAVPLRGREGRVQGYIGTQLDITLQMEEERRKKRELEVVERVTQLLGAGLALISKKSRVIWANSVLKRRYGEIEGTICPLAHGRGRALCPKCAVMEVFLTGRDAVVKEQKSVERDGEVRWNQIMASPIRGEGGGIEAVLELVVPITERKISEQTLRESEERFRRLAGAAFEGIVIHGPEGIIDCNLRFAEMVGREPAELVGTDLCELISQEQRALARECFSQGLSWPHEFLLLRKGGEPLPVEVVGREIPYEGRRLFVSSFRDISERKEVERLRRERERSELYGLVVSALPLIVPGPYQEIRMDLLKTFAERFEAYFRPRYEKEMEAEGEASESGAAKRNGRAVTMDKYVHWCAELFRSFGLTVSSGSEAGSGHLEFHSCPWIEYSKNNPVFCILCRTMVSRSFSWACPGGAVGVKSTIAGGGKCCRFEFRQLRGKR
ncbi:MAG: PAS domain S-box protein [Thermoplasmata archaeon]